MSLAMTLRLAWKNIFGNRLRSGLTVLGIVIGITSVILLVGIVNGATQSIMQEMSEGGADIVTVSVWDETKALDYETIRKLDRVEAVDAVAPYTTATASVSKGGNKAKGATVLCVGESYLHVLGYKLKSGRDFSPIDLENSTKAVIIGSDIADKYWKKKNPCGDTLKLDGDDYTVIGVLKSIGSANGNNVDKTIMVPLTTIVYLGYEPDFSEIYAKAESEDVALQAAKNIRKYMRTEFGFETDNFDVFTQQLMLEDMKKTNRILSLLLGGIASISLLVGGIGVMNVMLVSVTERTREIGIRKSLGAKRRDIVRQFLIESMVLSVFGGIIGIVLGLLLGRVAVLVGFSFAPGISMVLISFGVSVAVGLIFGILPANRAAGLRPVEALRY